jgi:hypothetical protein
MPTVNTALFVRRCNDRAIPRTQFSIVACYGILTSSLKPCKQCNGGMYLWAFAGPYSINGGVEVAG